MTYGIIGAMDVEIQTLLEAMFDKKLVAVHDLLFHVGKIGSNVAVVAKCGIGKVNAARCAQALIDRFNPDYLINTGIAGGIGPGLRVGDIVIGEDLVQHDFDMTALGCVKGCQSLEGHKDRPTLFPAEEDLLIRFEVAAQAVAGKGAVHRGRISSGDAFIADRDTKRLIYETFGAMACEMEGGAIAQVACAAEVPFVVVRAISDLADGSASDYFVTFERHTAALSAGILLHLLRA